nr:hypothetical secreted protein, CobN/magnesium chelatase family [uncultured archaeon]
MKKVGLVWLVLVLFMAQVFVPFVVAQAQSEMNFVTSLSTSTRTGADGAFSFVNLSSGTYILTAYIESGRGNALGTVTVTLGEGEHIACVTINASVNQATEETLNAAKNATGSYNSSALSGIGSISGNARILMGPNYVGIPGITVLITGYEDSLEDYAYQESAPTATTCEGGYFRFKSLPAGNYTLSGYAAGENPMGVMSYAVGSVTLELFEGNKNDDVVVRLEPSDEAGVNAARAQNASYPNNGLGGKGMIAGTALIHMGGPYLGIANTTVAITAYTGNGSLEDVVGVSLESIESPKVITDENGFFEFTNLPAGNYSFIAHKYIPSMAPGMQGINKTVTFTVGLREGAHYSAGERLLSTTEDAEFVAALSQRKVLYELNGSAGKGIVNGTILSVGMGGVASPSEGVTVYLYSYDGEGALSRVNKSVNKEPKMAFFSISDGDIFLIKRAAENIGLNVSVYSNYNVPLDLNLTTYDVIFASRLYTEPIQNVVVPILEAAKEHNVPVICTYAEFGNINLTEHPYIGQYWGSRNTKNMERLLVYLAVEFCGLEGVIEEPSTIPNEGIYHPDTDRIFDGLSEYLDWYENDTGAHHVYNPDNLTLGLVFWKERYGTGEIGVVDKFIRETEVRGVNIIAAYPPYLLFEENMTKIFMDDGEPAVDVMIDLGLGMGPLTVMVKQREYLELLDVPVMKCVELYSTIEAWANGTTGKGPYFNMQIPVMEIAGEIEFIVVGGRVYNETYDISLLQPIDSQVEWALDRALSWSNLQYTNNSERKVAIIYYHHSVGNDSCLVAANLDVAPSIVNILHAMDDRGYALGENIPTDKELLDLVLKQGRNIGIWVPDQIKYVAENCDVVLVPEDEYLAWFNELPEQKRMGVIERWGPPPGEIMVYENESGKYIMIPKISLGNILIAPQPSRAGTQNMAALYHDKSVPPTHQYIAFYYWLSNDYGADAIVSVGRHGTQEWLPGKGVGLSVEDCWPAILIQDLPVVYHYEVEGIGEGVIAKRRGNAVMIDHLTPVIVAAGLYGNLSNLEQTIPLYEREENGTLRNKYKEQILEMCSDLNLDHDLGVDLDEIAAGNETAFEEFLDEMHDYLLEIKREYMPYGLHIMGKPLSNDSIVDMTKSLLGYEFRDYIESMNISANQTRMLLEAVIINRSSPKEAQEKVLGGSENVTESISENRTTLTRTTTDENGNYTFSNLAAGNYTMSVLKYISGMSCWFIGGINASVGDGEHLNEIEVWLTFGDETTANDILNMTDDPDSIAGTSSISGVVLAQGRYGVTPMTNATVIISRQDASDDVIPEATPLTNFLTRAVVYAENLRECMIEIPRTLDALEGQYIPPGPSNDPIRNPDVLPTGRNFYGFDPNIVPTEPAWEVGKELIDQLLSKYYNGTDASYPKKIGFVMFSFNTMKDLGVLESELFYLLGVEPVWDRNKNVIDVRLIPIEDLGRPRIDVVVTMSGIYRENWPHQIELINKAVRIASESDDSPYHRNYVNESTQSTYQWLIEHNYTESQARELSLTRIFGSPDGVWGVGGFIAAIEGSGTWANESTLADLYIRNMGNVYGDTIWGEQHVDLFKHNLDGTEVALFGWASHSHSVLGIDHTLEFFGGLSMAVRDITGKAPDMYISNLKDQNGAKLESLSHVILRDLRSMYFNPYWIEGMMGHDYAGARAITEIMANLWGWDVTCPDVIMEEMWNEMYSIYVQDKYDLGLQDWFDENNPWAQQSITARMLEAIRKGYWDPSEDVKTNLAELYQKSVEEYGVTCCHHTCGNPLFQDYQQGIVSASATEQSTEQSTYSSGGGGGSRRSTETETEPDEGVINATETTGVSRTGEELKKPPDVASEKRGKVMKEEKLVESSAFAISGAPLMGIIAVIVVLVLIGSGLGYKRRRR